MIKINLAKTHSYKGAGTSTGIASISASAFSVDGELAPPAKIAIMAIFLILVIGYEKYQLGVKNEKLAQVNAELNNVRNESAKFGTVTNVIEDLIKEKKQLNEQLLIIQKISQKRAFKLQAIAKVQENIPEDLWLTEMSIKKNFITFKGLSQSPSSVQSVVAYLNASDFVDNAENQELKRESINGQVLNSFSIVAQVKK